MTNILKKILIKKDNTLFTDIIDNEKNLFNDLDNSLNSFKEDHKLFEINLFNDKLEKQIIKSLNNQFIKNENNLKIHQLNNQIANLDRKKISPLANLINNQFIDSNIDQLNNIERSYILILKYNNDKLEHLLDELICIKENRSRTGIINYASDQIRIIKRKLIFLIRNQQDQFIFNYKNSKLFVNKDECLKLMNYILENNLEFKIDHNLELNSKLNNYLKINFKNELIIVKIFKILNLEYDCRSNVENYINNFNLKLEPKISLINLNRNFKLILKSMKQNLVIYDNLLEQYFKIKEQKDILKLRYLRANKLLINKLTIDFKQIKNGNQNLMNKINILERNLKRIQNKFTD